MIIIVVLVVIVVLIFFIFQFPISNFNGELINKDVMTCYNNFKDRFENIPGPKLPVIDQIYVISMPQRRSYIEQQMEKLNYDITYFDAVKPSDLSYDDYNLLSTINQPGSMIAGKYTRLPVLLSFIMCFVDALSKGYRTLTIFEDDISINVSKKLLEKTCVEYSKNPIDVLYMGYCFLDCSTPNQPYEFITLLSDPNLLCCHAMCVKTKILPGLINYCFPMVNNSDELFRDYYQKMNIKVGVPKNAYFSQNRKTVDSLNESKEDLELFKTCEF